MHELARWLRELYPPPAANRSVRAASSVVSPAHPRAARRGACRRRCSKSAPTLASRLLDNARPAQAKRALAVLTQTASRSPALTIHSGQRSSRHFDERSTSTSPSSGGPPSRSPRRSGTRRTTARRRARADSRAPSSLRNRTLLSPSTRWRCASSPRSPPARHSEHTIRSSPPHPNATPASPSFSTASRSGWATAGAPRGGARGVEEAVEDPPRAGGASPDAFLPDLAASLNNQSARWASWAAGGRARGRRGGGQDPPRAGQGSARTPSCPTSPRR